MAQSRGVCELDLENGDVADDGCGDGGDEKEDGGGQEEEDTDEVDGTCAGHLSLCRDLVSDVWFLLV